MGYWKYVKTGPKKKKYAKKSSKKNFYRYKKKGWY